MSENSGKIPFLPPRIRGLETLAMNLLWRWDTAVLELFRHRLDPVLWTRLRHNPVDLLRQMDPSRLAELAADEDFLEELDTVVAHFEKQVASRETWFRETFPEIGDDPVAYFCAEFGLHNSIPIYSGGLGVLAGDHCKSASDMGIPFVGVGLLYHKGYFDQKLNLEGWQEDSEEVFDPDRMPLVRLSGEGGGDAITSVEMMGRTVHVGAWRLDVGRIQLYLLDTNLAANHPEDRELSHQLYGGGQEYRLRQEWILGVAGVRVLRALGVTPGAWHANEGHAAFMMVERLREEIAGGASLEEAVSAVRARTVFTTHTPVPAGHDHFSPELMGSVCGSYHDELGMELDAFLAIGGHPDEPETGFHMTAAAIRLSAHVNGVSELHGRVSQEMWRSLWSGRDTAHVPIRGITNGVHQGTWVNRNFIKLYDEELGPEWRSMVDDPEFWEAVMEIDDQKIWETHLTLKRRLLDFCREESRSRWKFVWKEANHLVGRGALLAPEPLTIGFARRFATYKRAHLLFRDEERLARLLTDPRRPVQVVFSGKAHPADEGAKKVLQRVWQATRDPKFEGRIAFVEDYEMHVANRLVQGVDLWLNVPRVPMEASGTSGMKAALNGVPQLSTLDGWWAEGFDGSNGWAITRWEGPDEDVDRRDHESLFTILEREVVPAFYDRDPHGVPKDFVRRMKNSIRVAGGRFTAERMVRDYARLFYVPALSGKVHDDPPTDGVAPVAAEVSGD